MKMNRKYIYIAFIGILAMLCSCNDEYKDELYKQMVSFKAPVTNDGVCNIYVRYKENGFASYTLPIIMSGSQMNHKNVTVKVAVDNDTLPILNQERFGSERTDLYFRQLPESCYQLPEANPVIKADSCMANYELKFNLSGLDLVDNWVLPLTVVDDNSYITNKRLGWYKALLNVHPFNDYSGTYSSTAVNVSLKGESTSMTMDTRTANVVDENSIFFYAGVTWERLRERAKYKIVAKFSAPVEEADGSLSGILDLSAPDESINFTTLSTCTYTVRRTQDPVQPFLQHYYVTMNVNYQYDDVTSVQDLPITYVAKGSMTMERQLNTLIPDEDQAIEW
jgi:Domain of unknown function (DUF1735).